MKKLALVLGSLLVVGTAASAKEVMPAPVMVPERIVEIVEKPVIVYRDREVAPKWRPSGSVDVQARFWGEVEGHNKKDNDKKVDATENKWDGKEWKEAKDVTDKKLVDSDWAGDHYRTQLRTTASINFTENQSLEVHTRHSYGLTRQTNSKSSHDKVKLTHTYDFGKLGSSMVASRFESSFNHEDGKTLEFKPVFDFSEYFFKNDYVKATALELAPVFKYNWAKNDDYSTEYGLYANAAFTLPFGVTFQAEFDNLYNYKKENASLKTMKYKEKFEEDYDRTAKTGAVEFTLAKNFGLYNEGKHKVDFKLEGVYSTGWSYSKSDEASVDAAGTYREGKDKNERWGAYTAKFEPSLSYKFKATEYVELYARLAGEYKNRTDRRPDAKHWRWQPTARLGFKATF